MSELINPQPIGLFIEAIAPYILKQTQAIAQSKHCDRSILSRLG
jgi:hypothetical protein